MDAVKMFSMLLPYEDLIVLKEVARSRRTTVSELLRRAALEAYIEPYRREQAHVAKLEAEQLARQPKVYAYDEKGNPAYAGLSQKGFEIIVADMAGWAVIPHIVRDRYTRQQWTLIEEGIRRYCQEHGKPGPRDTEAIVAELKARAVVRA